MTQRTDNISLPTPESSLCDARTPAALALSLDPARAADRQTLFPLHPVLTRGFLIATPPLRQALNFAVETIASGAPCCTFIAFPRFGKTCASEYMKARLSSVFPNVPTVHFCGLYHNRTTERQFVADLLYQTCLEALPLKTTSCKTTSPALVLSRAWWTLAQRHKERRLILVGDEIQRLTADSFSWLIDVTNELHRLNVRTIAILFAQPELVSLRSALLVARRGDIVGRFLTRLKVFEGIRSSNQLREVMNAYDDPAELEYPAGSGWSFTRFFLPRAFANGWRLSSCAGDCWEQLRHLSTRRLKSPESVHKLSVGMEWIAGSIHHALLRFTDLDRSEFAASPHEWRIAIEKSGFLDSLGLTYDPQWSTFTHASQSTPTTA